MKEIDFTSYNKILKFTSDDLPVRGVSELSWLKSNWKSNARSVECLARKSSSNPLISLSIYQEKSENAKHLNTFMYSIYFTVCVYNWFQ